MAQFIFEPIEKFSGIWMGFDLMDIDGVTLFMFQPK